MKDTIFRHFLFFFFFFFCLLAVCAGRERRRWAGLGTWTRSIHRSTPPPLRLFSWRGPQRPIESAFIFIHFPVSKWRKKKLDRTLCTEEALHFFFSHSAVSGFPLKFTTSRRPWAHWIIRRTHKRYVVAAVVLAEEEGRDGTKGRRFQPWAIISTKQKVKMAPLSRTRRPASNPPRWFWPIWQLENLVSLKKKDQTFFCYYFNSVNAKKKRREEFAGFLWRSSRLAVTAPRNTHTDGRALPGAAPEPLPLARSSANRLADRCF